MAYRHDNVDNRFGERNLNKMKKLQGKYFLISLFGIAAFLALFIANGTTANYGLPPRNEGTPSEVQVEQGAIEVGSRLQLEAQFSNSWPWDTMQWQDVWTMIQWQDDDGEWFDVEGWRGNLDTIGQGENGWVGSKEWWAAKDILGSGPYRWQVYDHPGGELLSTSEPFHLSDTSGGVIIVPVEVAP
jgi:hypothetical protein